MIHMFLPLYLVFKYLDLFYQLPFADIWEHLGKLVKTRVLFLPFLNYMSLYADLY